MNPVDLHVARRTFNSETAQKVQALHDAAAEEAAKLAGRIGALREAHALGDTLEDAAAKAKVCDWLTDRLADSQGSLMEQQGRRATAALVLQMLAADFHQSGATLRSIQGKLDEQAGSKAARRARQAAPKGR